MPVKSPVNPIKKTTGTIVLVKFVASIWVVSEKPGANIIINTGARKKLMILAKNKNIAEMFNTELAISHASSSVLLVR